MIWKRRVYLDVASGMSGNPSSAHEEGRNAKMRLDRARERIARLLEVKADDVVFTGNATESNALAILGSVRASGVARAHVLFLPSAHASIVENVKRLQKEGADVEPLVVKDGRVDLDALQKALRPETLLVTMEAVCGETGVIWNTREVAEVLRRGSAEYKTGSTQAARPIQHPVSHSLSPLLHIDASQAPLTEKITRSHFGADLLTFDLSKISSERGLGVLVAHRTIPIESLYRGGGQERGLRPGSEAVLLAETFADALEHATRQREDFKERASHIRGRFLDELLREVPEALINEGGEHVPNILNVSLVGRDTDYLVALLDSMGFAVSTRSACETDSEEGSRAVYTLTGDADRAKSTLRISWGHTASIRELRSLVTALKKAIPLA